MKKTITILLIATSTTLFGQFGNSDYFLNANVGFAIDNAEQSFVKTHNYSISSIYDNNLTFIELALIGFMGIWVDTSSDNFVAVSLIAAAVAWSLMVRSSLEVSWNLLEEFKKSLSQDRRAELQGQQ